MKAALLLCLLAFISCEKDIIDIGKCIYKAPLVKELINDVMIAIVTKDYSKLLPKIKENLPELIQIVLGCINDTNAIEDENKLETSIVAQLREALKNCNFEELAKCSDGCKANNLFQPSYIKSMCISDCRDHAGCSLPPILQVVY